MAQKGRTKIRKGFEQALNGAKMELERVKAEAGKKLDEAMANMDEMASKVTTDEDVAKVVKGAKSLAHRGIKAIADMLEDKKEEPPDSKKK